MKQTKKLDTKVKYFAMVCWLFVGILNCHAEIIITKSGKKINGKILERTDKYIKVEVSESSVPETYFLSEIETIESEPQKPPFKTIKVTYKTAKNISDEKGNLIFKEEGKKTVYMDFIANKSREESVSERDIDVTRKNESGLTIFDGNRCYHVNMGENTAIYMDIPQANHFLASEESSWDRKFLVGQEKVLDKQCNAYKNKNNFISRISRGKMLIRKAFKNLAMQVFFFPRS